MYDMKRLGKRLMFVQALDVLTFCLFYMLVPASQFSEQNPIIATLYVLGGFAAVGLAKMVAASFVAYRAATLPLAHPRLIVVLLSIATASGMVGAGFNSAAILLSL